MELDLEDFYRTKSSTTEPPKENETPDNDAKESESENANKESENANKESENANKESVDADNTDGPSSLTPTTESESSVILPQPNLAVNNDVAKKAAVAKAHVTGENTNPNTNPAAIHSIDDGVDSDDDIIMKRVSRKTRRPMVLDSDSDSD